MKFHFAHCGRALVFDTEHGISIAAGLEFAGQQIGAFGLPRASAVPFREGEFVGELEAGAPVNCYTLTLSPHGNGTHTESARHILKDAPYVRDALSRNFFVCAVMHVEPTALGTTQDTYMRRGQPDDEVVSSASVSLAWNRLATSRFAPEALAIFTGQPRHANYTGNNPPYLSQEAMRVVRSLDIQHLLVDLPSVDREQDDGELACHRIFWGADETSESDRVARSGSCTITELIRCEEALPMGWYILDLQIPAFETDAAPSRPVLYPISEIQE